MNDQTKRDTARAKSRQGGGQAAIDTARAKSRQNGGDGGTSERMSRREFAAGLNLAGGDPMSGRGQPMPTMSEREAAAGFNLAGNDTMSGRNDLGPPEIPTASEPRTGNVDQSFDDFSPEEQSVPGVASAHAFQLVKVGVDALFVRQGTIGSIIPTIGGTALEADYTENELSLPGTATREYWLNVTVDTGEVTAVSIVTTEPGADSETQAKLLLGSVETDSGDIVAFNSNLSGSQSFASCGSTHFFGLV